MKTKGLRKLAGKTVAAVMAACLMMMPVSVGAAVDSTGNVDTGGDNECIVSATAESEWTVTIPKHIILAVQSDETGTADYEVSVTGKIDTTHYIEVAPDTSFSMTQGDVNLTATVTQGITTFDGKTLTPETPSKASGSVAASGLRAGDYEGSFNFHISEKN